MVYYYGGALSSSSYSFLVRARFYSFDRRLRWMPPGVFTRTLSISSGRARALKTASPPVNNIRNSARNVYNRRVGGHLLLPNGFFVFLRFFPPSGHIINTRPNRIRTGRLLNLLRTRLGYRKRSSDARPAAPGYTVRYPGPRWPAMRSRARVYLHLSITVIVVLNKHCFWSRNIVFIFTIIITSRAVDLSQRKTYKITLKMQLNIHLKISKNALELVFNFIFISFLFDITDITRVYYIHKYVFI